MLTRFTGTDENKADAGSIRRASLSGAGVAYLLRVTVSDDLASGDLV
ncbi:MAG: hypothetical protein JWP80_596 [Pseudomonas sp.]|nr:hypothetical protein [Pseudomonas sp.]